MGSATWRHRSAGRTRNHAIAPTYGAALALRALLPDLTAKVTGTRPCRRCGGPTASAKATICGRCKQ